MSRILSTSSLLVLSLSWLATAEAAAAPVDPTGTWAGFVQVRPAEYEVDLELKIERTKEGALTGWVSYPSEGAKDQKLEKVSTGEDGRLIFVARDDKGVESAYQGWLSDDGKQLDGDLAESGQHYNFSLQRGGARWLRSSSELRTLSADGKELITAFNEDRGQVRLLLVLSPSCPMCLNSTGVVQRYVLDAIQDPDLRVYVVWEAVASADNRAKAESASRLLSDPRVRQFWSADRFAGKTFQGSLGIKDTPAWDVFLLFSAGKNWRAGAPPAADSFMHNLFGHAELPKDRRLNGIGLAREVRAQLERSRQAAVSHP